MLAFVVAWPAGAAQLTVTLEGLEDELADAARANLTLENYVKREVTPAQVRRFFNGAKKEIRQALEPYGYYNVSVESTLQSTDKGLNALFQVTLGEPVLVKDSTVKVHGAAAQLPSVLHAMQNFKPAVGQRLDHGEYEASKSAIETALTDHGFLRAKATKHIVRVSRETNTADIDLEYESGPRLKFGAVHFSEAQFPPQFLERYIPWQADAYYSPDELLRLQQRLVDADYFSTVAVEPDLSSTQELFVPINVQLTPAKRTVYTAGLYVSTDTGPGARIGMQRRWMNNRGHKFNVDIDKAQRLESIAASYRIPLLGPHDKSLNFGVTYRDENTFSSQSRTSRVAANETRQWRGFTRTLGLQYLAGTFEIADVKNYSKLLYAESTLTKKEANDFFFPRRGYSVAFGLRLAPQSVLSDTSFSQVTVDAKWIRQVGHEERLILRSSLGTMVVDDFDELPPELRFFAGGDQSIRGFDYQQVGSMNSEGKVIGGTYLAVASAEIEHYFLPKWGAAVFVDGGDAFRTAEFNLNVGAGVGVRWRSPVGIFRVDVAKPVKSDLGSALRVHISIGPDL